MRGTPCHAMMLGHGTHAKCSSCCGSLDDYYYYVELSLWLAET